MAVELIENIGQRTTRVLAAFGEFWDFVFRTARNMGPSWYRPRNLRLIMPQLYDIGTRSVPVVGVTGAFIGMVLAIESIGQFQAIGQEVRIGSVINISVIKQIGPVLAAVMLAGRVGGALTAELGTMNVTEQLDAMRVMGADPLRVLVIPRLLACMMLTPMLTIYSDFLGVMGGWLISVKMLGVPNDPYWYYSIKAVDNWQIFEGLIKSVFFGAAIGLIGCYKGFTCGPGASGVGRACTESFVQSFIAIIVMNFFFAQVSKTWYEAIFGQSSLFTS